MFTGEVRQGLARIVVQMVREVAVSVVRGGPRDPFDVAPELPGHETDGCPYCAMWPHVILAMQYMVRAGHASSDESRDFYLDRSGQELGTALAEGMTPEVLASERGAAALDRLRDLAATTSDDLAKRARALWEVSEMLGDLAEGRNRTGEGSEA